MTTELTAREAPARYVVEAQPAIPKGYKQTEVGVIPEDWEVRTLGDSCELVTKGTTPTSIGRCFTKAGITFLKAESLSENGKVIPNKVAFIDEATHALLRRSQLMAGDILVSIAGVLGRVGLVNSADLPGNTNQALAIVRLGKHPEVESLFLFFCLRSPVLKKQIGDINVQAAQANISLQNVKDFRLPLPPTKAEQEAIAEALSDADALIEALEQLIAKKRHLKQGTMQELLTGKKRLPGFGGEWEVKRLGTVLKFQVGFPFSSLFFNEDGQGLRLVKNRDLKNEGQVFYYSGKFEQEFLVQNGDVLVGMDGDFLPCQWMKGQALLNQRVGRIVPLAGLNRVFAYYFLIEPLKEIENATSSTTVKHLSHGDIEGIEKHLPTVEEQTAIATILSDMDTEIAALEARLAKARGIKQGMMQELLTGRIRLV